MKDQLIIVSKEPGLPKIYVFKEILSWLNWKSFMLACSREELVYQLFLTAEV